MDQQVRKDHRALLVLILRSLGLEEFKDKKVTKVSQVRKDHKVHRVQKVIKEILEPKVFQ